MVLLHGDCTLADVEKKLGCKIQTVSRWYMDYLGYRGKEGVVLTLPSRMDYVTNGDDNRRLIECNGQLKMKIMNIYFDSKTGNVKRFTNKVSELRPFWNVVNIKDGYVGQGHLITYTAGAGQVPDQTRKFLEENKNSIHSVSTSGNRNWGQRFGAAARIINSEFEIPVAHMFELSGFEADVKAFITKVQTLEKLSISNDDQSEYSSKRSL